ncbi:MAG TPA: c-type cytochrome [Candidatus Eremiobacteraceae bacterium]
MKIRWILTGAGLLILVGLIAAYAAVSFGLVPANADGKPSGIERWAARTSLKATIRREATASPNPLPMTDDNLNAGLKLYATNCMACHGASDGKPSNIAQGLYQHAPQLGDHGVEDDPEGDTYWVVQHGIRLTGMPSFGVRLSDSELWQVVMFLKHMDKLPSPVAAAWKKEPSQSPKK